MIEIFEKDLLEETVNKSLNDVIIEITKVGIVWLLLVDNEKIKIDELMFHVILTRLFKK